MIKYTNAYKISAGAQYLPNMRIPKNYLQRMQYQLGVSYGLSNMLINGARINDYALTVGFNFPVNRSHIYLSTDLGYRTGKNIMSENYVMFTLGASISEIWFFKRFYE
jgi:hypothetical protein